ncbi:hypothetical protein HDV00_009923 [Rhizophlyctis rosea]|nr:hypothetical protein HDV00_009923 [Rhizophlyctis rosea]
MNIGTLLVRVLRGAYLPCLTSSNGTNCRATLRALPALQFVNPNASTGDVVGRDVVCSECWLSSLMLGMQVDAAAQQSVFQLVNSVCGLNTVADVYGDLVAPLIPSVPGLNPRNSTMGFDPPPAPPVPTAVCGPNIGKCTNGKCCSVSGVCGTTAQECGLGNCQFGYGNCTRATTDSSAECGPSVPTGQNATCAMGTCCSRTTRTCGTSASFCDINVCDLRYGGCGQQSVNLNATCGFISPMQSSCPPSQCCSTAGTCGSDAAHCTPVSCQTGYGSCGWPLTVYCPATTALYDGGGNIVYGNWTKTVSNSTLTVSCGSGGGIQTVPCSVNGTWGAVSGRCGGVVGKKMCPPSAGLPATWGGTNATVPCVNGWTGTQTAKCNADGTWGVPDTHLCTQIGCPAFDVFPSVAFNAIASGPCPTLFDGNQTVKCNTGGTWGTVNNSSCVPSALNRCTGFGNVNATQIGVTVNNATCWDPKIGTQKVQCTANGVWKVLDDSKCVDPTVIPTPTNGTGTPTSTSASPTASRTLPPKCASTNCGTFDTTAYVCCNGQLCPTTAPQACNGQCYDPTSLDCCGTAGIYPAGGCPAGFSTTTPPATTTTTKPTTSPTQAAACSSTNCGTFDTTAYVCCNGQLCPIGMQACNGSCYPPASYDCCGGALVAKGSVCTATTSAASTTRSPTSAASPTTTKASATPSPTTTTRTSPSPSPTSTSTASACTSTNCGTFDTTAYVCCNGTLCQKGMQACNGACYSPSLYSCCNNALAPAGSCSGASTTPSPTTSKAATTTTPASGGACTSTNCGTFDTTAYVCCGGTLCPKGMQACNGACYNPSSYACCGGALAPAGSC